MGQLAIPIAIASAATAAVVSYQGYQQAASQAKAAGDYNKRVYEYRAKVSEQDVEIIRRKNEQDKYYFDRDFKKYQGQTVVAYLKNGVSIEGGTPYAQLKQNYEDALSSYRSSESRILWEYRIMARIPDNPNLFRQSITTVSATKPGMQVSPQAMAAPAVNFASSIQNVADNAEKFLLIKAEEIRKRKINEANIAITSELSTLSNDLQAMRTSDEVSQGLFGKYYKDLNDDELEAMEGAMDSYEPENWVVSIEGKKQELLQNYFVNNNIKSKSLQSSIINTVNADFFKIKNSLEKEANNRIEKLHTISEIKNLDILKDKMANASSLAEINAVEEQAKSSLNFLQLKLGSQEYVNLERDFYVESATNSLVDFAATQSLSEFNATMVGDYDPITIELFNKLTEEEANDIHDTVVDRLLEQFNIVDKIRTREEKEFERKERDLVSQIMNSSNQDFAKKKIEEYKTLPTYARDYKTLEVLENYANNPDAFFQSESIPSVYQKLKIGIEKNIIDFEDIQLVASKLSQSDYRELVNDVTAKTDKNVSLVKTNLQKMYGVQIELIDEDSIVEPVIVAESLKAESEMNEFLFDNPDAKQDKIRLKQQEVMNASKKRINELIFGEMITSIDKVVKDNPQFESYFVKAKTAKDIFTILSELSQSEKLQDKNAFIAFNRVLRDFYGFRGTD